MASDYFKQRMSEISAEVAARPPRPLKQPAKTSSSNQSGYIYFMKAGNAVKIGFTTNPRGRLHSLRTGSAHPAVMVKIMEGTPRKEREMHRRFDAYRLRGEWFDLRGSLAKYLERCVHEVAIPEAKGRQPKPEVFIDL